MTFRWADPDGYPTSMAIIGRESASGAAIQFVYTPPELRGQGFALEFGRFGLREDPAKWKELLRSVVRGPPENPAAIEALPAARLRSALDRGAPRLRTPVTFLAGSGT